MLEIRGLKRYGVLQISWVWIVVRLWALVCCVDREQRGECFEVQGGEYFWWEWEG